MNTILFFTDKDCSGACNPLDVLHRPMGADLFELQLFLVDLCNGQNAWYGSLQNANGGEKRYFKGWSGLAVNLQEILTPPAQLELLLTMLVF